MKKILKSIRGTGSGGDKEKKDKAKGGSSKQLSHNKDGPNPLCTAAFAGDIDKASECIKYIGVNSLDAKLGKAPLHFAARGGHLQMIKFLIDEGADPGLLCSDGRTPLFSAIEGAHESCANWLISKGYCTDKQDSTTGSTVLHFAAYYGLPQSFRKIYTIHPQLISVYDQAGMMPIHVAVQAAREEIVNYICTVHPESCEAKTKIHEQTSIMLAVQQESMNVILLLLEAGCRTDAVDKYGTTVELLAKGRANKEISSLLNQWAPQNNIEIASEEKKSVFENQAISQNVVLNSISALRTSPMPQFNKKVSASFVGAKQSEPGPSKNESPLKETVPAAINTTENAESDEDSEWGSNSEAEGGQSKNESPLNPDLKKRFSEAFLVPIQGDKAENIFKPTKKATSDTSQQLEITETEGTLGREGTMKNIAETLVRNSTVLTSVNEEKRSTTSGEDTNQPQTHEKTVPKADKIDPIMARKMSVFSVSEDRNVSEDLKINLNEVVTKDKLSEMSRDNVNVNQESDISEWSNSNEEDKGNNNESRKGSSVSDADVDNMLLMIDKHNVPLKPKVIKPIENTDSENDSSWDSDAEVPMSNKVKENRSESKEPEKAVAVSELLDSPEVKVSNVISAISEDLKSLQAEFSKPIQPFIFQGDDEDEDGIRPEVVKGWVGVMSELTKRVGSSQTLTATTDNKQTSASVTKGLPSAPKDLLFSPHTQKALNIENENIPLEGTLSSQTCQITPSEIFGEIEASPKDQDTKQLQNIIEDPGMTTIFARQKSYSVDSGMLNTFGTKDVLDHATNDLNSPLGAGAGASNTLVPTLLTIPKLLDKNKAKKNKGNAKSENFVVAASDSIPLSSLLNDDVEVLKKKISKKSYFNPLKFSHGKSDAGRKMSCPESNVPPSFLSKMKTQFSIKKPSIGKSGSLPDVNAAHLQGVRIEESEQIVCELLQKAKDILVSTAANKTNANSKEDRGKMTHGDYQKDGQNDSSNEGDGCCDDKYPGLQGTYRSFQQPVIPLPATRYCDSAIPNDSFVLKEVLKDLNCVIDRTYGTNESLIGRSNELEYEVERLQKELKCCECCKAELQSELLKLQADFSQAQYALDELTEAKSSLEVIITQLRSQVSRQEEILDCESREKSNLTATLQEMELKVKNYGDGVGQLQAERDDLIMRCERLEEIQNVNAIHDTAKISDLEESLVRCCHQNNSFQDEINALRKELVEIRGQIETFQYEKRRLMSEFDLARNSWKNEKATMEGIVADLQRRLTLCDEQKKEICDRMNAIVAEHHIEMDKLSEDASKYKGLCDCMNEELETLKKKLRDCEEQKRFNEQQQQQQQRMSPINSRRTGTDIGNYYANSSSEGNRYSPNSGDCSQEYQDMKANLYTSNIRVANLEKDLEISNAKAANLEVEVNAATIKIANLEKDLDTANAKAANLGDELTAMNLRTEALENDLVNANNRADNFEKELDDANVEAENLEKALATANNSAEDFKKSLNIANSKAEALEKDLSKAKTETEKLEKALNTANNNADDFKRSLNIANSRAETLEKDLSKAKTETENLEDDLDDAKNKAEDLEKELKAVINIKVVDLEKNLETEKVKTANLEKKLLESKSILDEDKTTRTQQLEMELKRAINAQKRLQTQLSTLQEENDKHNNEYDKAQEKITNLKQDLKTALKALEEKKQAERLDILNQNKDKGQVEAVKIEYEELLELANFDISKLKGRVQKAEAKVAEAIESQKQAEAKVAEVTSSQKQTEAKYAIILKSAEEMEGKLGNLNPVASEAEFYKKEATRMQKELKDREIKVAELTRDLQLAKEDLQKNEENILAEALNKDQSLVYNEYQVNDLREKLKFLEIEKGRLRGIINNLEERIAFMQPRLDAAFEERKSLEEKVIIVGEENKRFLKLAEEERHNKDLFQRKLTDTHRLWESEVKAKGILAEKIANYERMNNHTAARNQQEASEVEKWKDKFRALRSELKSERELVAKLKNKFEQAKEQWKIFKEQMDRESKASDPKVKKLQDQIEEQKAQYEELISKLRNDREHLLGEIFRLGQSNDALKRELNKLKEEIQLYDAEKTTLENIVKSKNRLEVELKNLKRAIDDQYVDKTELERLKATYDMQIATVKSQYEQEVQLGIDRKYSEITQIMDKQAKDRMMIDQMRESNENVLRTELSTTQKSSQMEINGLKRLIREQEEQIKSEVSSRRLITEKFSVEKKRNEDLVRKLSLLSTARSETLFAFNNNNNNDEQET